MEQVKKISIATVWGKVKLSELIKARQMDVMQVIGSAIGVKSGTTSFGDYTCLTGSFEATNPVSGEVCRAAICFLPAVALVPIQVALSSPTCTSVDFAIMVSVRYVAEDEGHKPGGSPYEYRFTPLLDMGAEDPVSRIRAKLTAQKLAALPAPETQKDEVAASVVKTPSKAGK